MCLRLRCIPFLLLWPKSDCRDFYSPTLIQGNKSHRPAEDTGTQTRVHPPGPLQRVWVDVGVRDCLTPRHELSFLVDLGLGHVTCPGQWDSSRLNDQSLHALRLAGSSLPCDLP